MGLFQRATKSQSRLRLALVGPPNSGKTYSLLSIATGLAPGGRIAVIDTEHGSASKYADEFTFDSLRLADFDPRRYIEAIQAAEAEGYSVIGIDSLSHAWMGKGGALEMVDAAARRSRSNNTYTAWRDVTPLHNALVESMLQSRCHIIATMRTKVDYILETNASTGKQAPRKVGMAPIQREGMDYEFDVVGELDLDHNLIVSKTRCRGLDGKVFHRPGQQFAGILTAWLSDGTPIQAVPPVAASAGPVLRQPAVITPGQVDTETITRLLELRASLSMTDQQWIGALSRRGVSDIAQLSASDARAMVETLTLLFHKKQSDESQFPLEVTTQETPAAPVTTEADPKPAQEALDEAAPETFEVPDAPRPERASRRNRKGDKSTSGPAPSSAPDDTEAATDSNANANPNTLTPIEV